ncbi:hypothetical protein PCE1_003517 [Barthelona sp. PCE]
MSEENFSDILNTFGECLNDVKLNMGTYKAQITALDDEITFVKGKMMGVSAFTPSLRGSTVLPQSLFVPSQLGFEAASPNIKQPDRCFPGHEKRTNTAVSLLDQIHSMAKLIQVKIDAADCVSIRNGLEMSTNVTISQLDDQIALNVCTFSEILNLYLLSLSKYCKQGRVITSKRMEEWLLTESSMNVEKRLQIDTFLSFLNDDESVRLFIAVLQLMLSLLTRLNQADRATHLRSENIRRVTDAFVFSLLPSGFASSSKQIFVSHHLAQLLSAHLFRLS